MNAITFAEQHQVRLQSVTDPIIQAPSDAIVRVRISGLCGSDLHIYHGRETGMDAGAVMGHEFVGEVVETGSDISNFRYGDLVCSPFTNNCGQCFYCEKGLTARCSVGGRCFGWVSAGEGLQGAQAEFVRVPLADSTLVKVPAGIEAEEALLLGDNLSTGFFCADMAEAQPSGVYVVVGCGVVGLMSIIALLERGVDNIVALDNLPNRLELARQFGAAHAVAPDSAIECVHGLTGGRGADAVLEAVGSPAAQQLALRLIRPGGILAVVGVHTASEFAFSPFDAYNLNLTYKTGRCPARHYMERLVPVVEKHRGKIEKVITHRFPLDQGVNAYHMFDTKADGCMKIILQP